MPGNSQAQATVSPHVAGELFIDGRWMPAASGATFDVLNPATGASIGRAALGEMADIDLAVKAARRAFEDRRWLSQSPAARARVMFRVADLIDASAETIAMDEVIENGMPLPLAQWCVAAAAEAFRYFGGWVTKNYGISSEISAGIEFHSYTLREPVGVVGLIVPWNGPFLSACQKVAPALAAGCASVLKPAEDTPLNTLKLGQLLLQANVPAGVVNIVTGYGAGAGESLVEHSDVDKISFTGSTAVGRKIVQAASGNFKRLTLELGGKSPVIVLDDANMDQATGGILAGIMTNSGQVCLAGSRVYIQRSIYAELTERLAAAASSMKVGDGREAGVQIGPLISERQRTRVMRYIEVGLGDGARLISGGKSVGGVGYFVAPTILGELAAESRVMREEIFGPVLSVVPFDTVDEAVRLANDTRYGLAGAVYTRDIGKAHRLAKRVRGGNIYINCHGVSDYSMPFGGYRESGWGRESGRDGLDAYLETKSVFSLL